MATDPLKTALVEEAMKKSGLVWLELGEDSAAHARWHVWWEGRAYLLTGPREQPDPGLGDVVEVRVVVRGKDARERLIAFRAAVSRLRPGDEDWAPATAELAKGRLNLPAPATAPHRWATDERYVVYRLTPSADPVTGPSEHTDESHRAAPVTSPATTSGRLPRVFHRRGTSGRPLT